MRAVRPLLYEAFVGEDYLSKKTNKDKDANELKADTFEAQKIPTSAHLVKRPRCIDIMIY